MCTYGALTFLVIVNRMYPETKILEYVIDSQSNLS